MSARAAYLLQQIREHVVAVMGFYRGIIACGCVNWVIKLDAPCLDGCVEGLSTLQNIGAT